MNRVILILAAFAAWTATAATPNRTATEAYVTNKIAAAIAALPPPDFSTNNAELVETIQDAAPVPDYSTNNAELVETIQTKAPAPGDYATVSNRAMTAVQSLQPAKNYADSIAAAFEDGTRIVDSARYSGSASDAVVAYQVSGESWADQYNANDLIREATNAANAVVQAASNNLTRTLMSRSHEDGEERVSIGFDYGPSGLAFVPSALYTRYAYFDNVIIANENDTNGPLSGIGQYSQSPKTARQEMVEYVESAIREKSLGGIWDAELEVWWTPRMKNGSLTYEATTNVNLNAEN